MSDGEPFQGRAPDSHDEPELVAQPAHDDGRVHIAHPGNGCQWLEVDARAVVNPEEFA